MLADGDGFLTVFDVLDLVAPLVVELLCALSVPLLLQLQRHDLLLVVELALSVHHKGRMGSGICRVGEERLRRVKEVVAGRAIFHEVVRIGSVLFLHVD